MSENQKTTETKNLLTRFMILKAMNTLVKALYNKGAYYDEWLNVISDSANDEEIIACAFDDSIFEEAAETFLRIMKEYGKNGFCIGGEIFP